ncbi:transposase [Dysgonomonas sp. PFB1-18]|uniref:IS110 family transposase n=1 Tax=unclassified Dysgonomonas TaxID=2630389 RepID=UPI0013D4B5C1|nr:MULTISPECIES: IS110 family transposase [unclassified Dysgonomonas]MDH6309988.1 transposase [Dysgonomonas sp. PF1-14]MDH6339897.1 transposase [Dysgonomonas sp. PF1-16]MDH6381545.1 transposase [Dysgonomonas sp. PFB1-18]MDH6398818.1 transposase [Dysgonomonas sp. PF1-23]NDV93660.1 IS110 family transposase [Dysgonomonas sp. 521]
MKTAQRKVLDFNGQNIYVGIDVHLKSWSVTVLSDILVLKKFSQIPQPEALYKFLVTNYPGASYHSVYEAGFCGFWIHERLTALGINNIVVNPADVPTKNSEKLRKTDLVDSGKLARSLRAGELKGIYTPNSVALEMRSLIRLKNSITKDMTRQKNRIKSQLRYLGVEIPLEYIEPHSRWSKRFIAWLKDVSMLTPSGRRALDIQIRHLEELRKQKLEMTRALRELGNTEQFRESLRLIMTIPGVGQATGMTFLSEICDISRFENAEQLAAYIGMIPMCNSSGEKDGTGDITVRKHAIMRSNLIETAWVAIRQDPAMSLFYMENCKRMIPSKAIVKVARKLVNRLFFVLKRRTEYVNGIVS